jgi:Raf kinase inhibitor-like YbhB/YbcL family protein
MQRVVPSGIPGAEAKPLDHEEEPKMTKPDRAPIPYDFLPAVASLALSSDDLVDGARLREAQVADQMGATGSNLSPQLRWSGAPSETRSYAVTCFDPDAPTGSGFWHWVLFDLPAETTELPQGAGSGAMVGLPAGAKHARNDAGGLGYFGAAPPEGHGEHRYVFAVHALGIKSLGLDETASPAYVGFNLTFNTLARGLIVAVYER